MTIKERAKKLKTDIPALFLALKDRKTPVLAKLFAAITVIYALSPIDLIPDFIPVLGYLDDLIILFIPKDLLEEKRTQSETIWQNGRPEKWYYAIPFVLIWLIVLLLLVLAFI